MSTPKTARRQKAGQRNAQRGASHVGSGDVVVLGAGPAKALLTEWRARRDWWWMNAKIAKRRGYDEITSAARGETWNEAVQELRRLMASERKRQPRHNVEGETRGPVAPNTESGTEPRCL